MSDPTSAELGGSPIDGNRLDSVLDAGAYSDPAIIVPDNGTILSYGELSERVRALGVALQGLGLAQGSIVAMAMPDGPAALQLILSLASIGAVTAPLNPRYTTSEFAFYLEDLRPDLLMLAAHGVDDLRGAAPEATGVVDVSVGERNNPGLKVRVPVGERGGREPPAGHQGPGADAAILLHTSGTTSRAKQVPLTHKNLIASSRIVAEHYQLGADDRAYAAMPLFHVHGLVASVLATFASGGAALVPQRMTARAIWRSIDEHGATWYSAAPALHDMMLARLPSLPPPLRFVRSCSSALPIGLLERLEKQLRAPILEAYGMTEASHQIASNPLPPGARVPGSVGVATGTRMRIVDAEGNVAADGLVGEVQIRGPGVMDGYVRNPEATAEAFDDGWFRTGDLGMFTDAYLHLRGRIKELIIRGGENVSPLEVEEVLSAHPAVHEAAVFGIPDDRYGEVVGAAVTVTAPATEAELLAHCRNALAYFKSPVAVHIVDEIPRTPTGKLQRRAIADLLSEGA